ncbi:MAG: DNA polymerase III subunit beta [Schleiferiaceae bacterium]|jgi:DNA polymerase-3 subunit beta|nr:DNA polymerase III subunit beta [Schleiferiaceae bacterium]
MKFIVSSGQLLKELQKLIGVINPSNTLPILDNFLFDLAGEQLKITASDLETTMTTELNVNSSEDAKICIPAKILVDSIKSFPEQPLTFTVNKDNNQIEIASDFGKYALAMIDASDFPQLPEMEDIATTVIPGHILADSINNTLFASGNDELRPVMSGVFFQFSSSDLTFVATDAHKLVRYKRTDLSSDASAEFIMHKKPLNLLKSTLGSITDDIKVHFNETNAKFEYDNITLSCRLIDGKYPNYEAVIPQDNPNVMTIDRQTFLSSVKRVSIFSNKTTHQIRLKVTGNELHISTEDIDFSNEANERLSCEYEGADMEIGFNSRFIIEMLNHLNSEMIKLELSAPNRAGIISPVDGVDEGERMLMLIMPVMLNN